MSSPTIDPQRLDDALKDLQDEFELTDKQIAALPGLDDIELIPQSDSQLIHTHDVGIRSAHTFKLFVGEYNGDFFYVYLYKQSRTQHMKMEIGSVDDEGNDYTPIPPEYFGSIRNLAYPYNEWLGADRFKAAVKFYFYLGYKVRLYNEDPGFTVTKSWRKDLQGACDDLIAANEEMARGKCKKEIAAARKQRDRTPPPPPESRSRNRQHSEFVMSKKNMERNNDEDEDDWGTPPPPLGANATQFLPQYFGAPPPHSTYPTYHSLVPGMELPLRGNYPPPGIGTHGLRPADIYPLGSHHFIPKSDDTGADFFDGRTGAERMSYVGDDLQFSKPRKNNGRKSSKARDALAMQSKTQRKSTAPFQTTEDDDTRSDRRHSRQIDDAALYVPAGVRP
jgi:hypothetical protein